MFTDVSLVKVKTLTRKMANQIQIALYNDGREGSTILKGFQADTIRPLAWADGTVLDGFDYQRVWLVEFQGCLYWIAAPYGGRVSNSTPEWMETCCKNLPQIFIS